MCIWKCDNCDNIFEDFRDCEGDTCNRCDDGLICEVLDDFDYCAGELPVEGEDGFESELNRGFIELDENGKKLPGE